MAGDDDDATEIPPDIAAQVLRALDRSPATFTVLIGSDLRTRWMSKSSEWLSGTDRTKRQGRESIERVHPDDVPEIMEAFRQLSEANTAMPGVPVNEPLRYRVGSEEDGWITREALVHNMLHDPAVDGLLLVVRPVPGALDGVGHVIELLVADAPLEEVLTACADLVPVYLGAAAVVGLVDGEAIVGATTGDPAVPALATDPRWWQQTLEDGKPRAPIDFLEFPDDIATRARAAGFLSAWMLPITEQLSGEVVGCLAVWVRITYELNIGTDYSLRQARRLASLVIGEQRRHQALDRAAVTDPLTGVGNRSALRRRLDAAGDAVSLAFVDLDDFKSVNDTHGHDAGDVVLRTVARRLEESVREDDLVVRLGGDEFAVVLADGTPVDGIDLLVQRVLSAIERPVELDSGASVAVRASVGIATGAPNEVVHAADKALYASKRRNPSSR